MYIVILSSELELKNFKLLYQNIYEFTQKLGEEASAKVWTKTASSEAIIVYLVY